jgi:hypothetical protein
VSIPVTNNLSLELRITGATIEADIMQMRSGIGLVNGRLGGVIDANTADRVTGLEVSEIGLTAEDSLLDATFANLLGTLIGLPKVQVNPLDEKNNVDVCVDGDGTIVRDEVDAQGKVTKQCTEALDSNGKLRFVDGISVEINFETVPVSIPAVLN